MSKVKGFTQSPNKQQGVALMMVIMVFALVSILAVGMHNRQSLFIQLTGNQLIQAQAYELALSAEAYGRWLLKSDWDADKEAGEFVDDLEQTKNSILLPVDEAFLEAQFNDIHGKLNLNDLVLVSGSKNTVMEDRLKRLLNNLDINSIKTERIIDWIDENSEPEGIDGVEDGEYLVADPPYRAANQPMQDISELLMVHGVERKDYLKLLPFITVMPQGLNAINVNTASAEVLQSLDSNITKQIAESLLAERDKESWKDINAFKTDPNLNGINFNTDYLDVKSELFEIATKISLSDRVVRLVTVIRRDHKDGKMTLIKRDQGKKYLITKEKAALPESS